MRGYNTTERIRYWLFSDRIPITKSLILLNIITFVLGALFHLERQLGLLAFNGGILTAPWTLVTYPLVTGGGSVINILFSCFWLWVAGGSLERSWLSKSFAVYFFAMSAISALGLYVGGLVTGSSVGAAGLWLPLAGVTVAFAMLNPEQQILFFFVIPLKLKYLALIDAGMVLITYGSAHPLLGVFALAGCVYSYYRVRPFNIGSSPRHDNNVVRVYRKRGSLSRLNPFSWYKEARDRKRLRDLFERSDDK